MVGAGVALRVADDVCCVGADAVLAEGGAVVANTENLDEAAADFEGLLDGLGDARGEIGRHNEAVDNDFDIVSKVFV